ncbi:MAG: hypothetical protein FWD31_04210 [Planctomycetaceae bacterium]|nr:hypothetical protein [Planctomycetaceae bacterium]
MTDHNRSSQSAGMKWCLVFVLICVLCLNTGCQALLATFLLMTGGMETKAKYKFFKGKKVVVVCLAENMTNSRYDDVPRDLANNVGVHLSQNVKKIEIISPTTVNKWLDRRDGKIEDFQQFGKDMQADMVLAIYLDSFETSSPSSPGSYQGRAGTSFTVYEVKTGNAIASESLLEYVYPPNFRHMASEVRESDFKKRYLFQLSRVISCFFYSHDHRQNLAMDAHSELMR